MEEVIGKLKVVVFHNQENLYSVIKIKVDDNDDKKYLTVVGNFNLPNSTSNYKFYGEYNVHPRFGSQFIATNHEELLPTSKEEIIKYLSSPLFKGIGVKTAEKIVEALGEDAIETIKTNPDVLNNLVTETQKENILEQITQEDYFDVAVRTFMMNGLSMKMLLKIRSVYQEDMVEIVKENPYRMVDEVDGIGFKIADALAFKLGFEALNPNRIKAAMLHAANMATYESSSTYTSKEKILGIFNNMIPDIDEVSSNYFMELLIKEGKLYKDGEHIYPYKQYQAEELNVKVLSKFIQRIVMGVDNGEILEYVARIEKTLGINYDEDQKASIINCLNSGISIITGGPGTGKTTIINALIKVYELLYPKNKIILAAPTGRASKRLSLITGVKASTIHSHLKWDLHSNTFSVNHDNPLDADLLIIDEFSMVDNILISKLLDACENVSQIVIVGDDDQ